jgi:hypothetical protein
VQDLGSSRSIDKEAVGHSECHRWYREEIECGDHLAMIAQKGEPLLIGITPADHAPQIPGNQLLQFRVDFRRAPGGILLGQTSDQISKFLGDPRSAAGRTRPPAPIKPKAGAMPANDGPWFDNEEDISPAGP